MAAGEKRSFSLPREQAEFIDSLVASGAYASGSEVVRAGLRALRERDSAVERWLRDEVAPIMASAQADPASTLTADEVFDDIRRLHEDEVRRHRAI